MADYRFHGSEIAMGNMDEVTGAINENDDENPDREERAPQRPFAFSRNFTADIQRAVSFQGSREVWDSLPTASKLFMAVTFIDVFLVVGYCIWQFLEMLDILDDHCAKSDCSSKEEHVHVVLGMLVAAIFWIIFVIDSILQENDFELLACIFLTFSMGARVLYFIFEANFEDIPTVIGVVIVSVALAVTTALAVLTYNKFGWRIYSRLACDLRHKNANERTLLYFAHNRFTTLVKLDFQFIVLNAVIGTVMFVEDSDKTAIDDDHNVILAVSTGLGLAIGTIWLLLALYAVKNENTRLAFILGFICILSFIFPIGATIAVYGDDRSEERQAKESLLMSTGFLVFFRSLAFKYMRDIMKLTSSKKGPAGKSDFKLTISMSNKNPDVLPLLKGAWLIKQSPSAPNRRRFFQLSQDYTTLRWAWNSYVILYYVSDLVTDDNANIITLNFDVEAPLVVKFEDAYEYQTWKRGFTVILAVLLAPDNQVDNRVNTNLSKKPTGRQDQKQLKVFESLLNRFGVGTGRHSSLGSTNPEREARQKLKQMRSINEQQTEEAGVNLQEKPMFDDGQDESVNRQSSRIPSAKHPAVPSLDSNVTSGDGDLESIEENQNLQNASNLASGHQAALETIEYTDLEFGKLLGSGAEGAVWAAWYLDTPVAVKKTDSANEQQMITSAGQHDNIVGLRGLAREGSSTYIVLEYCPRGTLDVLLHHTMTARWDPKKVLQMIRGIARGVLHLHSRKPAILHRDLKPANIFIGHGLVLKIGDFGMSRHIQALPQTPRGQGRRLRRTLTPGVVGTASYSAPELLDDRLQGEEYDPDRILKADVYSFGVMMWEIIERKRPFDGMQFYEIVAEWSNDPKSMQLEPVTIPKDLNPMDRNLLSWLQELLRSCTAVDPDRRPDMRYVVKRLKDMQIEIERTSTEVMV